MDSTSEAFYGALNDPLDPTFEVALSVLKQRVASDPRGLLCEELAEVIIDYRALKRRDGSEPSKIGLALKRLILDYLDRLANASNVADAKKLNYLWASVKNEDGRKRVTEE